MMIMSSLSFGGGGGGGGGRWPVTGGGECYGAVPPPTGGMPREASASSLSANTLSASAASLPPAGKDANVFVLCVERMRRAEPLAQHGRPVLAVPLPLVLRPG